MNKQFYIITIVISCYLTTHTFCQSVIGIHTGVDCMQINVENGGLGGVYGISNGLTNSSLVFGLSAKQSISQNVALVLNLDYTKKKISICDSGIAGYTQIGFSQIKPSISLEYLLLNKVSFGAGTGTELITKQYNVRGDEHISINSPILVRQNILAYFKYSMGRLNSTIYYSASLRRKRAIPSNGPTCEIQSYNCFGVMLGFRIWHEKKSKKSKVDCPTF